MGGPIFDMKLYEVVSAWVGKAGYDGHQVIQYGNMDCVMADYYGPLRRKFEDRYRGPSSPQKEVV